MNKKKLIKLSVVIEEEMNKVNAKSLFQDILCLIIKKHRNEKNPDRFIYSYFKKPGSTK